MCTFFLICQIRQDIHVHRYFVKGWWAGISTGSMATEISVHSQDSYFKWLTNIPYSIGSEYVHPNPRAIWEYLKINCGKVMADFSPDDGKIMDVGIIASECMLDLMKNFDRSFILGRENIIKELESHFQQVYADENKSE